MTEILNNINEAERGGLLDLGKALRKLLTEGGGGGGGTAANTTEFHTGTSNETYISPATFFAAQTATNLIDGATITVNMSAGLNFVVVISGDQFFANPINVKAGQDGIILIIQDAVGGHQPTWGTNWKFNGTPTLYDGPHAWTLIRYWAQTTSSIRCTIEGGGSTSIAAATVSEIREGLDALSYISPAALIGADEVVVLTDAATIDVDLGLGINFEVTLTANRTIGSPLDQMPGRSGEIIVRQDATGGHALAWHADWKFLDGTPTLPGTPLEAITFNYRVIGVGEVRVSPQPIAARVEDYWTGTSPNLLISPSVAFGGLAPVPLTDAATVTPDFATGIIFTLTVGGDRLIANPTNPKRQTGFLYIKQDGTGGHALSWGSNWQFIGGFPPVIPTDPDAEIVIPYWCMSDTVIVCSAGDSTSGGTGSTGILPASTVETKVGLNATKYVSPFAFSGFFSPVVLTDGATITPDMNLGTTFIVTLGGDRTIANITNQRIGFTGSFIIIQDATGNRLINWGNHYFFQGGLPVRPTGGGTWSIIPYVVQDFGVIRCISPMASAIPPPASVTEYRAGTSTTKYISPQVAVAGHAPAALTDGATIAVDLALGINFRVEIAGNRSIANATNQIAGQSGVIIVYQDAVGGRTLTWGSEYKPDGAAIVIGTDPSQKTVVPYLVESTGIIHIG